MSPTSFPNQFGIQQQQQQNINLQQQQQQEKVNNIILTITNDVKGITDKLPDNQTGSLQPAHVIINIPEDNVQPFSNLDEIHTHGDKQIVALETALQENPSSPEQQDTCAKLKQCWESFKKCCKDFGECLGECWGAVAACALSILACMGECLECLLCCCEA